MKLSRLVLRHFRNLGVQDLEVPPEGVAIVGDNAQGKSNLLEAIYYLETFRSFRGARDERLIAFGQDVFRISATLCASGQDEDAVESAVSAAFQRPGGRKKVTVDGAEAERVGDALGHLAAVIFSPADIQFISGGPAERRRFLNVVLSLNEPGYLGALQHFRHVLAQRNAALKDGQDAPAVHAWDGPLLGHAAVVMDARQRWISEWNNAFADICEVVSGGQRGHMVYEPNVPRVGTQAAGPGMSVADEVKRESPRGVSGWEDAYGEALARTRERERRQGVTVVGPHRDDVRILVQEEGGELDLREYGSGGQRRTAALALRLIEAQTIRRVRGRRPLILMDDVFAELDSGRSERVLELLDGEDSGQVILTAPKEGDVRLRRDSLTRWKIKEGKICA